MPVISLPGPVEIDECHLRGRIKGNIGRFPAPANIIFGIKCRTTNITLLFPVTNKSQDTLLPIIEEHIQEGAQIISDKFSTYVSRNGESHLEPLGYEHYYVNHSLTFVDPVQPHINTNGIERQWRALRASISHVRRSIQQEKIQSYLDTFIFESLFDKDTLYEIMIQILQTLSNE